MIEKVFHRAMFVNGRVVMGEKIPRRPYLLYEFPENRDKIAKLTYDQKLEWYQHQFEVNYHEAIVLFNTKEFRKFWYWHVALPTKIRRFYFRLKNFEIFKHYPHITEMKKKK